MTTHSSIAMERPRAYGNDMWVSDETEGLARLQSSGRRRAQVDGGGPVVYVMDDDGSLCQGLDALFRSVGLKVRVVDGRSRRFSGPGRQTKLLASDIHVPIERSETVPAPVPAIIMKLLENTMTSHVFTPDRSALMALLASQSAVSLEPPRSHAERQERGARVRRLGASDIIGIVIWGLDGRIIDANDAFLRIVGRGRDNLVPGRTRLNELTPVEWRGADERRLAELKATGIAQPYKKEFFKKDGTRVPVMVGGAIFDGARGEAVAFVSDLTDRKRAEDAARESERRYHELQMELVHANRVATVGQLSASIAHEVKQPLSGIVTNAGTCLRMLAADPPNVDGARETARRTIRDASRASDVISRLHALFAKKEPLNELIDLNEALREVIGLSLGELQRSRVILRTEFDAELPRVKADRVQLQQVILNLLRNASDAMSTVDNRPKQLVISTAKTESDGALVKVEDAGLGVDPANLERIFDAFYTTKPGGLGMGLSICRAIIEAHKGRLWATPGTPQGAIFQFILPQSGEVGAARIAEHKLAARSAEQLRPRA